MDMREPRGGKSHRRFHTTRKISGRGVFMSMIYISKAAYKAIKRFLKSAPTGPKHRFDKAHIRLGRCSAFRTGSHSRGQEIIWDNASLGHAQKMHGAANCAARASVVHPLHQVFKTTKRMC